MFAVFLLAIIGFSDATYLTWAHYSGTPLECNIWNGCNEVASSEYSAWFGVPIALLGMIYYAGVIFLMLIYLIEKSKTALQSSLFLTGTGLAFSFYFVYLQFFVIDAVCLYCMVSAVDTLLLFTLISFYYRRFIKSEFSPANNARADIINNSSR